MSKPGLTPVDTGGNKSGVKGINNAQGKRMAEREELNET
jgi:hypothetical protein